MSLANHRVRLRVPSRNVAVRVVVFDEYGNQLVSRSFATLAAVPDEVVPGGVPIYRRWPLWASAAVVSLAGGIYFRHRAEVRDDQLDRYEGTVREVFFTQAHATERSRDRNHIAAIGMFSGAAAFAAIATWTFVIRPDTAVSPTVEGSPGITVSGSF
jgi:hypothetical protein